MVSAYYYLPLSDADKDYLSEEVEKATFALLIELWLEQMPFIQKAIVFVLAKIPRSCRAMFDRDRTMIRVNSAMSAQTVDDMLTQTDMNEQSFRAFFLAERGI